jgi:hypothetical protein
VFLNLLTKSTLNFLMLTHLEEQHAPPTDPAVAAHYNELLRILREHPSDYKTADAFMKWADFRNTGDPLMSLKRQTKKFAIPDVKSPIEALENSIESGFGKVAEVAIRLHSELSSDNWTFTYDSAEIYAVAAPVLSGTMDLYAFTRFFHDFKGHGQHTIAKNVVYLAGRAHTMAAKAWLQTLSFNVIAERSGTSLGSDKTPILELPPSCLYEKYLQRDL